MTWRKLHRTCITTLLTWILLEEGICMLQNDCKDELIKNQEEQHAILKIDEYYIEHEISALDAKLAAAVLDPENLEIPAGCKRCTNREVRYCLGPSLINDHCCCDRRFQEMFHYVPHTCYIGENLCQPIARDCGEYARLRACCCDKYVAYKWKALSKANRTKISWIFIYGIILFLFY